MQHQPYRRLIAGLCALLLCLAYAGAGHGSAPLAALPASLATPPALHSHWHGYTAYWGSLHRHSSFSTDGPCRSPDELYQYEWHSEHFDFLAITDHDTSLSTAAPPQKCGTVTPISGKWQKLKEAAARNNVDGQFVALHGFEWTHPNTMNAHVNVINSENLCTAAHVNGLYAWLAAQPDRASIYAQFNHPLESYAAHFTDGRPSLQAAMPVFRAIESFSAEDGSMDGAYSAFLRRGWKLGPVGYDDNHTAMYSHPTFGVWAEQLTREGIVDALLQRRTFSAMEPLGRAHPTIATALRANGFWMGQTIHATDLHFEIYVRDPVRTISKVELIPGRIGDRFTRASILPSSAGITNTHEFSLTFDYAPPAPPYDFYYVRVSEINEQGAFFFASDSAPIFVNHDPASPTSGPSPTPSPAPTPSETPAATRSPSPLDHIYLPSLFGNDEQAG